MITTKGTTTWAVPGGKARRYTERGSPHESIAD